MANALNGYCGTVTLNGDIVSNGNFQGVWNSSDGSYTIEYDEPIDKPVPVVSLTTQLPGLTYKLYGYQGGFKLYVSASNGAPTQSSFNFVVAEIG